MRLQKLEIKGFKSFQNDTVINFKEDVIGIVGPNGSGKSNIVDAIRWVLGEQKSRELRLDQMTSVIFNGTKKRKPAGLAQVSLTFENTKNILPTDYQTVTITRMLYRSGESEYRLNGIACRLKDITSLFLDTGIGSNSYAIIALGMVDDILNDKDNSRRRMFEQAAGISKYKIRKRETINKLKSTTEDLDRVEDLLFEINNNLVMLEKQAKRAKRYFKLKEQYKELSIVLAVHKIKTVRDRQAEVTSKLQQEEDRFRACEIRTRQLEAQLETERKAILDEEKALSEKQRSLNKLVGQIRGKENDKRMLEQKMEFVEQNKSKLAAAIQQAGGRIAQLEEDIDFYRSNLNFEKHSEEKLEEELEKAEAHLNEIKANHASLKTSLDSVMADQRAIEQDLFELEKQKAVNLNHLKLFRNTIEQNEADLQTRMADVEALRTSATTFQTREDELNRQLADLEEKETERLAQLENLEQQQEDLNFRKSRLTRELDSKRNEYQLTKSMVENLEGFPDSIRFLKNSKDWQGKAPLLTDLAYVQEEYRTSIENFLEPYLNYYVVEQLSDAVQGIQLLSKAQKGKAHFFVLDALPDAKDQTVGAPEGYLPAISVVEVDGEYQPLFNHLLRDVYVVEADQFDAGMPDPNWVLLANDGSFVKRRESISGGSVGLFEGNKIGRKKTLEVLTASITQKEKEEAKLSAELDALNRQIRQLKTSSHQADIQSLKSQAAKLTRDKVSVDTRLENFEQFIDQVQGRIREAREKIAGIETDNTGIKEKLQVKELKVQEAKANITDTDSAFREVAEKMSRASSVFNEKNIEFIKQQNKVTSIQRDLSYREKELAETQRTLKQNESTLGNSDSEVGEILGRLKQLDQELVDAYRRKKEGEGTLSDAEQKYFEARGKINEVEDELRQQQKIRTDAQVLINSLREKSNDFKFEVTSIAQRLRIEFEEDINYHINQPQPGLDGSTEELQMKVERLKSRLDNYGEINPMAVQAYDEMKERHDNISQQRTDILEAKESLLQTIKEIEETATTQFLASFEQARLYFINVFRSLFTADDSCDLILLSPETPLESKIEIVAKPKGKRPQSISQLSGGEKTLTATALLFALYLLKPAPFCIFDEVDAPLDDANISKFNNIIKKFSKDSQFIIVTHNKLTMAAVDTIYGVYMPEQGVSAVSQVDFRSFEHSGTFEAVVG